MDFQDYKIKGFIIRYDGIYRLSFENHRETPILITFNQLDCLFKKENISFEKIDEFDWFKGVKFSKTTLILQKDKDEGYFRTSEIAEFLQDKDLFLIEVEVGK